jgi:multidrug resistance efflux pump
VGLLAALPTAADTADIVASAPGRVEGANDIIPIGAAVTGVIERLIVKEGDRIKTGQVLLQVDCKVIEAEIHEREAEVQAADMALKKLKAGARDEELALAVAEVRASEARAEEAKKAYERVQSLPEGVSTRSRLNEVERDSKIAEALFLESRERLNMLQAGARGEDVGEAEAKKAAAVAALEHARAELDQCTVRSPINGVVLATYAMPGQFITTAAPATLLSVVNDGVLRVRAEIDEYDLAKICLGQHAEVTADGFKGTTLSAEVTQINPAMGRRTILSGDPAEKSDRDVREALLTLDSNTIRWPIGLRVLVVFARC